MVDPQMYRVLKSLAVNGSVTVICESELEGLLPGFSRALKSGYVKVYDYFDHVSADITRAGRVVGGFPVSPTLMGRIRSLMRF